LVSSDSLDGTQIVLNSLFGKDLNQEIPSKSALSQYRNSISSSFFQSAYLNACVELDNFIPRWHGMRFLGIDGDVYSLPRNEKLLAEGFTGHAIDEKRETHSLKMYTVTATDLISNAPLAFEYSNALDEISLAIKIVTNTKKSDVCIYDRLFCCAQLIEAHKKAKNFFVFRLKTAGTFKEITEFMNSNNNFALVTICGVQLRLIKTWISEKEEPIAIATNLPPALITDTQLGEIYTRRWGSETANRDTTVNEALDAFHGRDLNKILQEIYACLFLRLITAITIASEQNLSKDFLTREYIRPSFKQVLRTISEFLHIIVSRGFEYVENITSIIKRSCEKRIRRKRSAKREVGYPRKKEFPTKVGLRLT